eukprot:3305037-Pleurochrysis_carterae.AAC.1
MLSYVADLVILSGCSYRVDDILETVQELPKGWSQHSTARPAAYPAASRIFAHLLQTGCTGALQNLHAPGNAS